MKRTIALLLSIIMVLALVPFSALNVGATNDYDTTGNIALGCPYDTKGFCRTDEWGVCDYTANLTDGKASSELTYDNNWFAFCTSESDNGLNAPEGVGVVTIDLGSSKRFKSIKVNVFTGSESRIAAPVKIQAYISDKSNAGFISLGELKYESSFNDTAWATLNTNAIGRYIKIQITLGDIFAFINEVAVYGNSSNDNVNVALGKIYDTKGYVMSTGPWPGNYTASLTDGKASKELNYDNDWFGFCLSPDDNDNINAPNGVGSVTIDLEAIYNISRIRVNAMMGQNVDEAAIYSPARVSAYVSDTIDGTYKKVGDLSSNVVQGTTWVELNVCTTGRYVKIEVVLSGVFAFINEIEVYSNGIANGDAYADPDDNPDAIIPNVPNDTKIVSVSPENGYIGVNRDATIKIKFNEAIGGFVSDKIKLMKCNGWSMNGGPAVTDADEIISARVSKDDNDPTVLCIMPYDLLEKNEYYYISIANYSILFINNKYYGGLTNVYSKTPKYYFVTNGKTVEYATLKWGEFSVKWDENLEDMFAKDPSNVNFAGTPEWKELAMLSGILSGLIYGDDFTRIRNEFGKLGIGIEEHNEQSTWGNPGYIFAHKQIVCGGKKKTLVIAVFRGTNEKVYDIPTDLTQYIGGMNYIAIDAYDNAFRNYLNQAGISRSDSVFLVAGHSLGGGVANAFAWELTKTVGEKNVFAYTFASPLTNVDYLESNTNTKVNNISNFVGIHDVVPHVGIGIAFVAKHYGKVYQVMTDVNPSKAHGLDRYLECVRDYIYIGDTVFLHGVLIQCPVDVELLDGEGNTVGKIIGNKVTDDTIVPACVIGDDKYFFYEGEGEYTVKLMGTDSGTMDYTVFTVNTSTEDMTESKAWTNVELYDGKTMIGEICTKTEDSTLMTKDESGTNNVINQDGTETPCVPTPDQVPEPDESEPDVSDPDVSEPDESEPDESEPDVSEPDDSEPDKPNTAIGDIDGDGSIGSMDYLYLKRAYFSQYPLSNISIGDIDKDGAIGSMDYLYLKRAYFSQYVIG